MHTRCILGEVSRYAIKEALLNGHKSFGELKQLRQFRKGDNSRLNKLLTRMREEGWVRKVTIEGKPKWTLSKKSLEEDKQLEAMFFSSWAGQAIEKYVEKLPLEHVARTLGAMMIYAILKSRQLRTEPEQYSAWLENAINLRDFALYFDKVTEKEFKEKFKVVYHLCTVIEKTGKLLPGYAEKLERYDLELRKNVKKLKSPTVDIVSEFKKMEPKRIK